MINVLNSEVSLISILTWTGGLEGGMGAAGPRGGAASTLQRVPFFYCEVLENVPAFKIT